MRWNHVLLAAVALTPLGCVETEVAAKPAADPPAADQRPPAPPRPAGPQVVLDDTDPVVTAAQLSGERVARYEERIDEALSAVAADLQTLSGTDFLAVDRTAEKLLTAVQLLRASGERILERYPRVKADLAGIVKANAGVKAGYGRARELYREKAEAETGDLRERYRTLADLCDAFLRTSDGRTARYAAFAKDLDKAVAKVDRHVQFLADCEAFLKLYPGTQGAKERADFLASLNAFAEQVLKMGDALKHFRDAVRDGAVSVKLRAEHEKALAAARADREKAVAMNAASDATATAMASAAERPAEAATAQPVRYVPVVATRCVRTLVPVVTVRPGRGPHGWCGTVTTTHYEWRHQHVTETRLVAVRP